MLITLDKQFAFHNNSQVLVLYALRQTQVHWEKVDQSENVPKSQFNSGVYLLSWLF